MRWPGFAIALIFAGLSLNAHAQDSDPPSFAVPAVHTSPLPDEMGDITVFHSEAVDITGRLRLSFFDLSVSARGWPLTLGRPYSGGLSDTGFGPGWASTLTLRLEQSVDTGTVFIHEADGTRSAYARDGSGGYEAVAGRISSRVYPDGAGFRRIYSDGSIEIFNAGGRLLRRIGIDGAGYDLVTDDAGRLAALRHDDGQTLSVTWSGRHIAEVSDEIGRSFQFTYENGRLRTSRDALGRETGFTYDEAGRLAAVNFVDGTALSITYDVNGRVAMLSGPDTLETSFDHWGSLDAGRLVQTLSGSEGRTLRQELARDAVDPDQLSLTSTDQAGEVTVRDFRNGQTDVSQNNHWLGAVLHDAAGSAVALVRPDGMVPLDGAGRDDAPPLAAPDVRGNPQLVYDGDGESSWREYDVVGRLIASAGAGGRIERFEYDAGNRLVRHIDVRGDAYAFNYDAADRLLNWTGPGGQGGAYEYNGLGLVMRMTGEGYPDQTLSYDDGGWLVALKTAIATTGLSRTPPAGHWPSPAPTGAG